MPSTRKYSKWTPSEHKASGRWRVTVPANLSDTGKRKDQYFDTQKDAEQFIKSTLGEREEHGKQSVSSEERFWINVARKELGNLDKLREVLDHWKRTGRGVEMSAKDATEIFIAYEQKAGLSPKTMDDIRWRLRAAGEAFGATPLHQITPGTVEAFIGGFTIGWSQKSFDKRLRPFFAYAHRQRWLMEDPMDELDSPETPREPRAVYRPEDFQALLQASIATDGDVFRFIALSGLAFFRTRELVRRLGNEPVLEWTDVLWDRKEIHVREEVGKHTRRSSNERFVSLHSSLDHCLEVGAGKTSSGRIVNCSFTAFRRRVHRVFDKAGVQHIENGLRKSAISYWLAAHEHGVGEVARWAGNSESSCRKHYLRILTKDQGKAWFNSALVF
jgi:hypothetical protein